MEAFELRLWDGRLGRWLTVDPYYEFSSPYLGMGNNPISLIDPDGGSTEGDPPVDWDNIHALTPISEQYEVQARPTLHAAPSAGKQLQMIFLNNYSFLVLIFSAQWQQTI
jgi:hypothetical protein